MSHLTTHILDTTRGRPAAGVLVILTHPHGETWTELARGTTNQDGRIPDLLPASELLPAGVYKLTFQVQPYFERLGSAAFYPFVEIVFTISSAEHYHVPLLLNPFGYSTYRGS